MSERAKSSLKLGAIVGTFLVVMAILLGHTAGLTVAAILLTGVLIGRVVFATAKRHRTSR